MKKILIVSVLLVLNTCSPKSEKSSDQQKKSIKIEQAQWTSISSIDIEEFNSDLEKGKPTIDVGIYFPSNFDTSFKMVTLSKMMESLEASKQIYEPTGVQINLLWVKTGEINPKFLAIQANEVPGVPNTGYVNLYEHSYRNPAELTSQAKQAFEHIIEPDPDNHRTIYLIALQDVFYPFLTVSEGRNWMMKTVRTGGLSFPSYSYPGTIPRDHRGVITISNLARPDRFRRTIAHEIGHKAMNVSHEYKDISPEHEVYAEGGLMVYGLGEEILSGQEGRWHVERLLLSPYIYKLNENGGKEWNPDYKEGGHYYDPIYGEYSIHFEGTSVIGDDW